LARWETAGWLEGIITQNIDGLHQLAGSQSILELHGTARAIVCLQCGARYDAIPMLDLFRETGVPPSCPACGGLLKSATVSFGQNLPDDVWADAVRWCEQSEVFVVMGSSLVVEPAARLPGQAKRRGAKLVIINRDETPLDDRADLVVNESIGEFLTAVDRCMGDRPTQDQ
jgi:NAD-dependent deacetylase